MDIALEKIINRNEVSGRFSHLFSINGKETVVDPIISQRFVIGCTELANFAFVVWEA